MHPQTPRPAHQTPTNRQGRHRKPGHKTVKQNQQGNESAVQFAKKLAVACVICLKTDELFEERRGNERIAQITYGRRRRIEERGRRHD